jgi:hypothetical protein
MDVGKWWGVTAAARAIGVHPRTLLSGIERGEVAHEMLGDGTPVVELAAVREWAGVERRRGPKPRPKRCDTVSVAVRLPPMPTGGYNPATGSFDY